MAQLAAEHDLLVTVEEGALAGGFGSAVWETLNEAGAGTGSARIMRVGLPDRYVTHGKPALLTRRSASPAGTSPNGSSRLSPARRRCGHRGLKRLRPSGRFSPLGPAVN